MHEIVNQVESAKKRLAEVTEAMDFDDLEVEFLDEALDALDDAIISSLIHLIRKNKSSSR